MSQQSKHDRFSWRRPSHSTYRLKRTVIHRLTLIASICCVFQFLRLHVLARKSLEAKYTATDFGADAAGLLEQYQNVSTFFVDANRSALIAAESSWRPLGAGFEGSTFVWNDHVIKTFNAKRSPFRDCLDSAMANLVEHKQSDDTCVTRWPTEIPASLTAGTMHGFLPVSDAFLAHSSSGKAAQWYLVTPLIQGGTLRTLAKSVSNSQLDSETIVQTLDERFRPKFHELLVALQHLHERGLCHDDIKAENIFISTSDTGQDGAWLIGDLGNVRQASHQYHSSALWTHSNRQLPDCRANDAMRMIKTYLQFLRRASESSSGSGSNFDESLFKNQQPWSRLFWRADDFGIDVSTGDLLRWSMEDEHPTDLASLNSVARSATEWVSASWLLLPSSGRQSVYAKASATALETSAGEGWVRALALTWVFGVPVGEC